MLQTFVQRYQLRFTWASCSVLLAFCTDLRANTVPACLRFSLEAISSPCRPGWSSGASVNQLGHLTGSYHCAVNGLDFAFVWDGAIAKTLPVPQGYKNFEAIDLNASDTTVGWMLSTSNTFHACLFNGRETVALGLLPGHNESAAAAVNGSDPPVVVGKSQNNVTGPQTAIRWIDGKPEALVLPLPPYGVANAINDAGVIIGWMGPSAGRHAFIWNDGNVIDLGVIPGGSSSEARGLNNRGDVVGSGIVPLPGGGNTRHAFVYLDGVMTDIGTLPGFNRSDAYDINDGRVVVGHCSNTNNASFAAFVWKDGVMTALDDVVTSDQGQVEVNLAYAINNTGQIAGSGEFDNEEIALLLTPVPPIPGDLTCDWIVDGEDLGLLLAAWGECAVAPQQDRGGRVGRPTDGDRPIEPPPCPADLNADTTVDGADLGLLLSNWTN